MCVNDEASSQGAAGLIPLPSQFESRFKRSFRMSITTKEQEEARTSHLRSRHNRSTCGFPVAAGLEQPGRGQPAGRRSSSVFTPHLQRVSAALEGFPCRAHMSRAIAQFFTQGDCTKSIVSPVRALPASSPAAGAARLEAGCDAQQRLVCRQRQREPTRGTHRPFQMRCSSCCLVPRLPVPPR